MKKCWEVGKQEEICLLSCGQDCSLIFWEISQILRPEALEQPLVQQLPPHSRQVVRTSKTVPPLGGQPKEVALLISRALPLENRAVVGLRERSRVPSGEERSHGYYRSPAFLQKQLEMKPHHPKGSVTHSLAFWLRSNVQEANSHSVILQFTWFKNHFLKKGRGTLTGTKALTWLKQCICLKTEMQSLCLYSLVRDFSLLLHTDSLTS